MAYTLAPPQKEEILQTNYHAFLNQPIVREFLKKEGTICLACNGRPVQDLQFLAGLGQITFGEKYVQEALPKLADLKSAYPQVRCQYFGKLQTNKIKKIVSRFDTLESVASKREIDFLVKYKDQLPFDTKTFFLEVNIGKEAQKNGVPLEQVDHLLGYATTKDLKISGLMTIPPKWEDPVPFFKQLRKLADQLGLESCQMGFSADYPQAIDCGATHIRIGRLIFEGLVK